MESQSTVFTEDDVLKLVERALRTKEQEAGRPQGWLAVHSVEEHDFGWVFFWHPADPEIAIGGNAPFLVTREGVVHATGTAEPIGNYVERFRRWGNPHATGSPTCAWCNKDRSLKSLCPSCAAQLASLPGKLVGAHPA